MNKNINRHVVCIVEKFKKVAVKLSEENVCIVFRYSILYCFITARVAKRAKVMFSQMFVCSQGCVTSEGRGV